jgi:putative endonuclease
VPSRAELGVQGEQLVAEHLEQAGYQLLARNVRVGRLELDLIARRGDLIVICEVRTRASRDFVDPILTIDRAKRERVRRAARGWIFQHGLASLQIRLDAASVILNESEQTVVYYEAAF